MTEAGRTVLLWWGGAALVIVVATFAIGRLAGRDPHSKRTYAVLLDSRGRFSLTHLQVYLWSLVVISMIAGVTLARAFGSDADPFAFSIPDELLLVMGISLGSAATAVAAKAARNTSSDGITVAASSGAAREDRDRPHFVQVFLVEEGDSADEAIDITKFQNFWLTLILVVGYVVTAIDAFRAIADVAAISTLPPVSGTFVTLLGISHAAYVAGKLPSRPGIPLGLTLARKRIGDFPKTDAALRAEERAAQRAREANEEQALAMARIAEIQQAAANELSVAAERLDRAARERAAALRRSQTAIQDADAATRAAAAASIDLTEHEEKVREAPRPDET